MSKSRPDLVPAELVEAAARQMDRGKRKNGRRAWGWLDVDPQHYAQALERHLLGLKKGEVADEDGDDHLDAIAATTSILTYHRAQGVDIPSLWRRDPETDKEGGSS